MKIRTATEEDSDRIAELLGQLGYPATEDLVRRKLGMLTRDPAEEVAVAEGNGEVVGVISIHFIPQLAVEGPFARISYFCVDEEVRGRGVGVALEGYCERAARARGCDRIEVHCHSRRKLAHRFYFGQGYKESPKYLVKLLTE